MKRRSTTRRKRQAEAATIKEQIAALAERIDRVETEGFIRGLEAARRLAVDYPEMEDAQAHANRATVCNVCDAGGGAPAHHGVRRPRRARRRERYGRGGVSVCEAAIKSEAEEVLDEAELTPRERDLADLLLARWGRWTKGRDLAALFYADVSVTMDNPVHAMGVTMHALRAKLDGRGLEIRADRRGPNSLGYRMAWEGGE